MELGWRGWNRTTDVTWTLVSETSGFTNVAYTPIENYSCVTGS